jgi:hypothetical protein
MSDADVFQKRCQSLENAFFSDLDQKLIAGLQAQVSEEEAIKRLGEESGISDASALKAMHQMGVTPAAVSAVRVFPLIAIAWADGNADSKEATAVRAIASRYIESGSEASKLLEHWLTTLRVRGTIQPGRCVPISEGDLLWSSGSELETLRTLVAWVDLQAQLALQAAPRSTALHLAVQGKLILHLEIAELLLKDARTTIHSRDKHNKKPFDYLEGAANQEKLQEFLEVFTK